MSAEDSLNVGKGDVVIADHAWRKFLGGDFPRHQAYAREHEQCQAGRMVVRDCSSNMIVFKYISRAMRMPG